MGHLYHGYVSHNQRVIVYLIVATVWSIRIGKLWQLWHAVTIRPRKKRKTLIYCLLATMSTIFWLLRFVLKVWNTPTRLPLSEKTVHCRFRDPKICQVSENSSQGYSSRRPAFSPSCRCGILCRIRNLSSISWTNNPCSQPSSHRHSGTSLGRTILHPWLDDMLT